jgi:hypothetical protein
MTILRLSTPLLVLLGWTTSTSTHLQSILDIPPSILDPWLQLEVD